jgi:hypothetical protein
MTEKQLRRQVEKFLKSLPNCWFCHPADRWTVGLPDFIICYKGKFMAIELKREGRSLTKMQEYTLMKIRQAGGLVVVAYSLNDVGRFLEGLRRI